LPIKCSKDFFDRVLRAYFELKDKKPILLDNLATIVGIDKTNVSRANTFLDALKMIKKSGRELEITKKGKKYIEFLIWDDVINAKQILKEIFEDYA